LSEKFTSTSYTETTFLKNSAQFYYKFQLK